MTDGLLTIGAYPQEAGDDLSPRWVKRKWCLTHQIEQLNIGKNIAINYILSTLSGTPAVAGAYFFQQRNR